MSKDNTAKHRASTAKLGLGEDTIMRATPQKLANGSVKIQWSYRPMDGSPTVRQATQGGTLGQARMRARRKLEDLEAATGGSSWKLDHKLGDYVEQVSRAAIEKAQLAPLTMDRYEISLELLLGRCEQHVHKHSLSRHTIGSGTKFPALAALLQEIALGHGRETARQCRTVLTKYVLTRLIREGLIDGNPIAGVSLNELTGTKPAARTRGGKALSLQEYDRVIDHLLSIDPAEGIVRRQGRWPLEVRVAKRRNAIDQALFQAATGLRSSEANGVRWSQHIGIKDDGTMYVKVSSDIAKSGIPRVALVLDERVKEHLIQRRVVQRRSRVEESAEDYVIGSPHDAGKIWDRGNRNDAAKELYKELARELRIKMFEVERSHAWRTTLHTLYGRAVPTAVLDSQFGNSKDVRAKHYTDASDLSALSEAVSLLRGA